MSDLDIGKLFADKGKEYGFDEVTAEFSPEGELKIAWIRCGKHIDFWVTDYLENAPEDVLRDLAEVVFRRIKMDPDAQYPDSVINYVGQKGFRDGCRPRYMSRIRGLSTGTEGRNRDLAESHDRLVQNGLADKAQDVVIRWAPMNESRSIGHSSAMMGVVTLNRILDVENVSDEMLDFCLYTQLLFVSLGKIRDMESRRAKYNE